MRSDIVPGGVFPDYELPNQKGDLCKLSGLQGEDPMILTLARGNYCPKEHQQHLELAANYPKIAVAYTQVVTIATDDHHTLQEFRGSVGADWTFLSDPARTIQKDLDIREYTDTEHDPMIPHTLVLKPGLVIHRIYNGYWFWGRPSFVDLEMLDRVTTRSTSNSQTGKPDRMLPSTIVHSSPASDSSSTGSKKNGIGMLMRT